VPFPRQAVDLLKTLRALHQDGFVFPGDKPAWPISQNTMIFGRYRMGYRGHQEARSAANSNVDAVNL
jgi:hypothetical protein